MKLQSLRIQNYKSLRDVAISPKEFSAIVGRNSSGKSNFADALEFISIAYADGLEHAVARKGGYENIAHRKERRSRSAIAFAIEIRATLSDEEMMSPSGLVRPRRVDSRRSEWIFRHSFEFKAAGEGIRSDFKIVSEEIEIIRNAGQDLVGRSYDWIQLKRDSNGGVEIKGDLETPLAKAALFDSRYWSDGVTSEVVVSGAELLLSFPFFRPRIVGRFSAWIKNIAIFQLSPDISRHPGVPTPNPRLSARGENLPAVVDWLQRKRPKEWKNVLQAMRDIVPELEDITVTYLHTRTLGLLFTETGIGRPWTAEDVSDGTIRALSILVACFDPRNSALVVEEPENSLHPWIIKEIVSHLRELAKNKLVMITSHSPVVLNLLSPDEIWVIFKTDGETQIKPLVDFDSQLMGDWNEGKYTLFEYLESGFVREAVP